MSQHGLMKRGGLRLHNTILARKMSAGQKKAIQSGRAALSASDLSYPVGIDQLPDNFDPYSPEEMQTIDPSRMSMWFIKTDDGRTSSTISIPSDQAGCGSCWAFAGAVTFTCRIRAALLRNMGQKACTDSSFFRPIDYCTGEVGIEPAEGGGVVNISPVSIVGIQTRTRISPYYTATFAPKLRDDCSINSPFDTCVQHECRSALMTSDTVSGKQHADLHVKLGSLYPLCLGCSGNHISMPMILYTGATSDVTTKGAPTIEEYGLFDWACTFGDAKQQQRFCPSGIVTAQLRLYSADRYAYITPGDLQNASPRPMSGTASKDGSPSAMRAVMTMEELIMCELYNYGPVTIGYDVYDSFQQWGNKNTTGQDPSTATSPIYTADDFIADIHNPKTSAANRDSEGGHAVVIYGYGQRTQADGTVVKFWRVLNSWGRNWGCLGHFYLERNIDQKLEEAGLPQRINFEQEMATVYFAPDPNPSLYGGKANPMTMFMHTPPYPDCPHADTTEAARARVTKLCSCVGSSCPHVGNPQNVGAGGIVQSIVGSPGSTKRKAWWVILVIVLVIFVVLVAMRLAAGSKKQPATTPAAATPVTV